MFLFVFKQHGGQIRRGASERDGGRDGSVSTTALFGNISQMILSNSNIASNYNCGYIENQVGLSSRPISGTVFL